MRRRIHSVNLLNAIQRKALVGIVLISVLLSACASSTPSPPTEVPEPDLVKLGYLPIIAFQPFFIAIEKGYFAEQGIEIEAVRFRSGSEMIAPLATGELDVGGGQIAPSLLNAINQGMEVVVVGGTAAQPPGYGGVPIMVRKDLFDSGEFDTTAEMAGKTFATNVPNSIGNYLVNKVLEWEGLTLEDIDIVTMPFPEIPTAFENKAIDFAIVPSPLSGKALGMGVATVLVPGDEVDPGVQNGVMYFGKNFMNTDSDLPVRFLIAYLKGARDVQGDGWKSEENLSILSEYTGQPLEVLTKLKNLYYNDPNGRGNVQSMLDFQSFYVDMGYLEDSVPLALDEITDFTYLDKAIAVLGEYTE